MGGQWHIAADLGNTHINLAVANADRVIYTDIRVKPDVKFRHRPFRAKCPKRLFIISTDPIG